MINSPELEHHRVFRRALEEATGVHHGAVNSESTLASLGIADCDSLKKFVTRLGLSVDSYIDSEGRLTDFGEERLSSALAVARDNAGRLRHTGEGENYKYFSSFADILDRALQSQAGLIALTDLTYHQAHVLYCLERAISGAR